MTTPKNAPHQPGTYVKGDDARLARSASQAAALAFDGYVLQVDPTTETTEKAKPAATDAPAKAKS